MHPGRQGDHPLDALQWTVIGQEEQWRWPVSLRGLCGMGPLKLLVKGEVFN